MSDKWECPTLPKQGDADHDLIFAGVGKVVCAWEEIEVAFSHLYSCFDGSEFEAEAMYEYEEQRQLIEKAERHFMDQKQEKELEDLVSERSRAKDRRNEVAHGVLRPLWWVNIADNNQALLVPRVYQRRNAPADNIPIYAYNHALLVQLADNLLDLAHRITGYRNEKFPPRFRWL